MTYDEQKTELAKKLKQLRAKRTKVSATYRELTKEIDETQDNLVVIMEEKHEASFKNTRIGNVIITSADKPKVENWDLFWRYIKRKNYGHMINQSPHTDSCREFFQKGLAIPGISKFTKKGIRIDKIK